MQSRRDQVQAHSYLVGRLTSALVNAEPDAAETPSRRTTVGWGIGAALGLLGVIGFAIFGLIMPGGKQSSPSTEGLYLEKDTGTRYVLSGGRLYPVLNYTSAVLLLKGLPPIASVSAKSLAGIPHAPAVGIIGAPDALPAPAKLATNGWLVCSTTLDDGTDIPRSIVTLRIGGDDGGQPVGNDRAVLVQAPDRTRYLAWNGRRLKLSAPWVAGALGLGDTAPVPVGYAWLNTVLAGPDLGSPVVVGRGQPGPAIGATQLLIGQVVVVHTVGSGDLYYLVGPSKLTPLTKTQVALALGDPAIAEAYPGMAVGPISLRPDTVATYTTGADTAAAAVSSNAELPVSPPKAVAPGAGQGVCTEVGSSEQPRLVLATPPSAAAVPAGGLGVTRDARVADRILVAPGSGALVRPLLDSGVPGAALYLVTDLGVKYPLPSAEVAAMFGYPGSSASVVSSALLALLPTGPVLDPSALGR